MSVVLRKSISTLVSTDRLTFLEQVYGPILYMISSDPGPGVGTTRYVVFALVVVETVSVVDMPVAVVVVVGAALALAMYVGDVPRSVASNMTSVKPRETSLVACVPLEEPVNVLLTVVEEPSGPPVKPTGGTSAGQRLHSCLDASQYRSTTHFPKPAASRLDIHRAAAFSSKRLSAKHAAVRETPGLVTKLTGISEVTSR